MVGGGDDESPVGLEGPKGHSGGYHRLPAQQPSMLCSLLTKPGFVVVAICPWPCRP